MKLLENMSVTEICAEPISESNTSIASNTTHTRPKLSMIWVKEWREGRQCLIAKWVTVD
jgi:hypothetical protein